jgi:hypothetical protein
MRESAELPIDILERPEPLAALLGIVGDDSDLNRVGIAQSENPVELVRMAHGEQDGGGVFGVRAQQRVGGKWAVGAAALPQIACTLRSIDVFGADGRMRTMTCTAAAVQQTVDRTPRGAFNPPI